MVIEETKFGGKLAKAGNTAATVAAVLLNVTATIVFAIAITTAIFEYLSS